MIAENDTKAKALEYARRGWAVFPVKSRGKNPATPNGFKDASSDPAVVEAMFADKNYNLAVATGPASGIWVLDVESAGLAVLECWQAQHGTLPTTVSSITGGGGRHYCFDCNGVDIRNKAKIAGEPIDVRGDGGYIVVPPSIHPSGSVYQWEHDPESTPIVTAPEWLVNLVLDRKESADLSLASRGLAFTVGGTDEDLASAPGAEDGTRHDTALRLIGAEIGRGTDQVEVANMAVQWGRRCTPPMPDDEVLRIVSDLGRKEAVKVETELDEIEREELPPAPDWPVLADKAYHGLAGEIVRTIEPESEADPVGLLVQILVMFGSLIGRFAHFMVEGTRHYGNLFAVLVGQTAKARKGTSEGRVRELFRLVDENWVIDRVVTGLVSGEGLIWNVRDPICKQETIKEKGRVVGYEEVLADPGIDDKRLLVVEPEFASVLRVARREQNTLSPTIRSAWDTGNLRTLAKNSPARATGAHVSIIGHITAEELTRTLAEVENFSGFSNRFLWALVRRSKYLPDGGRDIDLAPHAFRIQQAAEFALSVARMRRDDPAARLWREVYPELSSGSGGLLGAVTSRAEAQVLRLSIVYALLDSSPVIQTEHLQAALALWEYCRGSAQIIFGRSTGDPLADRLLVHIEAEPGIRRRDLRRKFPTSTTNEAIVKALGKLRDLGRAYPVVEKKTKPSERWYPGKTPNANDKSANTPGGQADLADLSLSSKGQDEFEEIRI